ncbi:MAG TPA: hypothetical protein VFZ41_05950 [Solirubrobacterales bacterium]
MDRSKLTTEQRQAALAERIAVFLAQGWRVEALMDFQVILVKGRPANLVFHLLLGVITFGVWLIFWPAVALDSAEHRVVLAVDEAGRIGTVSGSLPSVESPTPIALAASATPTVR